MMNLEKNVNICKISKKPFSKPQYEIHWSSASLLHQFHQTNHTSLSLGFLGCHLIVRGIEDLGRVVIPKEIRRTMRIREGDPSHTTLTLEEKFAIAVHSVVERYKAR